MFHKNYIHFKRELFISMKDSTALYLGGREPKIKKQQDFLHGTLSQGSLENAISMTASLWREVTQELLRKMAIFPLKFINDQNPHNCTTAVQNLGDEMHTQVKPSSFKSHFKAQHFT